VTSRVEQYTRVTRVETRKADPRSQHQRTQTHNMGVYRVEASPNNRAGCQTAPCKKEGVKITKGELRFAVQVTINEHQSWQYRHWGCVTPKQIENLLETCGGDTDMVDGFDELPDEYQDKIKFALEHRHVPDEDWKGDIELNRPGVQGKKKRAPKKNSNTKDDDANEAEGTEEPEDKPKKKRAVKAKAKSQTENGAKEDIEDPPQPAKKRGRPAKREADVGHNGETEAPSAKKAARGRGKKIEYKEESDESEAPPPKKTRGRKTAIKAESPEDAENDEVAEEEEAPRLKKSGKKAATTNSKAKALEKKGRKKKALADE